VPTAALVELTEISEQSMQGGVEVRRLFRNPLPQLLKLAIHDDCIASSSDMPIRSSSYCTQRWWTAGSASFATSDHLTASSMNYASGAGLAWRSCGTSAS
jgi:hypothetical protein